jgi:hypothetical protein
MVTGKLEKPTSLTGAHQLSTTQSLPQLLAYRLEEDKKTPHQVSDGE